MRSSMPETSAAPKPEKSTAPCIILAEANEALGGHELWHKDIIIAKIQHELIETIKPGSSGPIYILFVLATHLRPDDTESIAAETWLSQIYTALQKYLAGRKLYIIYKNSDTQNFITRAEKSGPTTGHPTGKIIRKLAKAGDIKYISNNKDRKWSVTYALKILSAFRELRSQARCSDPKKYATIISASPAEPSAGPVSFAAKSSATMFTKPRKTSSAVPAPSPAKPSAGPASFAAKSSATMFTEPRKTSSAVPAPSPADPSAGPFPPSPLHQ